MNLTWGGQHWQALADKALYWEERSTLILSDLHLGKAGDFQAAGIAVPNSIHDADLAKLGKLVTRLKPERVLILGDFVHSNRLRHDALIARFHQLRALSRCHWILAIGNHDRRDRTRLDAWGFDQLVEQIDEDGIVFSHHECAHRLCVQGHVHPVIRVSGQRRRSSLRLPCFVFGRERLLLPSFGEFTGGFEVTAASGDRILAVADGDIYDVSRN